jgi:hypothetical protein
MRSCDVGSYGPRGSRPCDPDGREQRALDGCVCLMVRPNARPRVEYDEQNEAWEPISQIGLAVDIDINSAAPNHQHHAYLGKDSLRSGSCLRFAHSRACGGPMPSVEAINKHALEDPAHEALHKRGVEGGKPRGRKKPKRNGGEGGNWE